MLKTTELSKRKRSQGSTDTELSPSSVQLKKIGHTELHHELSGHPNVPLTPTRHLTHSPTHYQVPYPQMALPGSYPMVSPGAGTGPQQAFISDLDIQRIAEAVRGIVVNDVQTLITPLKDQISTLQKENLELRREIDELEMYSVVTVYALPGFQRIGPIRTTSYWTSPASLTSLLKEKKLLSHTGWVPKTMIDLDLTNNCQDHQLRVATSFAEI